MCTAHVMAERGATGATLVDPDTQDVSTGMIAAGRLQALIESRARGTSVVELIAQLDRIIRAIHDSVPEELGMRSCARSMDLSRLIYRRMTSRTATTRRASTAP